MDIIDNNDNLDTFDQWEDEPPLTPERKEELRQLSLAEYRGMALCFDRWAEEGDWHRFKLYLEDIATPGEYRNECLLYMKPQTLQLVRRFETMAKLEKLFKPKPRKSPKRSRSKGFG
jgi:hypothetical protein